MFSFATIIQILTSVTTLAPEVIAEFESLLANPAVQQLEALFGKHATVTPTPGAAAVVEPKATAAAAAK